MMWNTLRLVVLAIGALLMPSMASAQTNPCGMVLNSTPAIFCDNFDVKKDPAVQSRTGDLDPNVWGASRATGQNNPGSQTFNAWPATSLVGCNGTTTVLPPNDVVICNGKLREATNDNATSQFEGGTVTVLAMYPKQPFDFAGRTGTISFDVSNDTQGSHAAWPEFWFTDVPVPAPFSHQENWKSLPQHGFAVRLHGTATPNQTGGIRRWTVGSVAVIRNYVLDDTEGYGTRTALTLTTLDSVISSPENSGILNHVEIRVSQNQIDVYATDSGVAASPATLKHIARATNANLTATRGLIWLEDAHYNADKASEGQANPEPSQRQHTFVWDNVAFDGPFTYRDFSYDALDANAPTQAFAPNLVNNLAKVANPTSSWDVLNVPANPNPALVRVLFNFLHYFNTSAQLSVTVNGHAHVVPWPYPDTQATWRTHSVIIPVTDLIAGTNVVEIGAVGQYSMVANVNIVLVNVPGGVPVLPGSNNAYPGDNPPPSPLPPQQCTITIAPFTIPQGQNSNFSAPATSQCQ